jgi:hypothetical protein
MIIIFYRLKFIVKLSLITGLFIYTNGCSYGDTPSSNISSVAGFTIKGLSMVAPVQRVDESVIQPMLDIHANSISIMPYAFCTTGNPVVKYNEHKQHWGENKDGVIGCIQLAHENNISVMLKPHLWIGRGNYTGAFTLSTEQDWLLWENSFREYILLFASVADSMKVEIFCIGTEFGAAVKQRPQFWISLIDTVKKIYKGKLTYAANWDDYKDFPFWSRLDYIGVDAYFPLSQDKTPSLKSLNKSWKKYSDELERLSVRYSRPVLFTEYGYRNVDYSSTEPWKEKEGDQNDKAQVNAYEALYQNFSGKAWFAGGYAWKWYVDDPNQKRRLIDYTPQGKATLKTIKKWYSR